MNDYAALLRKYDVPVPRYTSYPTVPNWNIKEFSPIVWLDRLKTAFNESNNDKGISIYIHLPFCESLCTYCACNTRITKNHGVEEKYIASLLQEWTLYRNVFQKKPLLRELHIGGGTPTFFNAANVDRLLNALLKDVKLHPEFEFSIEGHPNNTLPEHLNVLEKYGFKRISFGVQDLSERVQRAINRIQPIEKVKTVVEQSRERGFESISFDLVYGLPFQTIDSIEDTMLQVLSLSPDRISFYSYAHVPWLKPGQRGYEDADLPSDVRKRALYERGRDLLVTAGYMEIGMDHFALPHDSLYKAQLIGNLHRNFMGYTTTQTDVLIGLGASSISETRFGYAQNVKSVEDYEKALEENCLPISKGHLDNGDDRFRKSIIQSITSKKLIAGWMLTAVADADLLRVLVEMEYEGLLVKRGSDIHLTEIGVAFTRNICNLFDAYKNTQTTQNPVFSKAI